MPQKSFEQYERELMEMYRLALAKDPSYAALAKRHSQAMLEDRITEEKKIDVEIPAPTVEETVPLPKGLMPVAEEAETPETSTMPMMPAMPETSTMPMMPAMPEASTMPMMPAMPETSTMPTMPPTSRTPAMPEASTMPTMPTTPRTPAMPEASIMPTMPTMPMMPAMPETSTMPTMPPTSRTPATPEAFALPKLPASALREPLEPGVATFESFESPALAVVLPVPDTISQTAVEPQAQMRSQTRSQTQTLLDTKPESTNQTEMQSEVNLLPTTPTQQQPPAVQQAPPSTQTAPTVPAPDGMRRAMGTLNMGAGNLIVDVTTQNRTKPVMDAVVTVTHPEESGNKVVAKAVTDNSGKTELIRLPAPIREIPVYPQPMIGGDLSAQYLVTVEAPGFESATDEEISVFDGVTSVKRIDLVSATDSESSAADENRNDNQRE